MKLSRSEFLRIMGLSALAAATGCGGGGAVELFPGESLLDGYKNHVNLFGDIHVHTVMSDGDESPDYAMRYARDVAKLDFCCLSDHAEVIEEDGFVGLPYLKSIPAKYDDPGKFCTLFGYEWSSPKFGHRNVYSLDTEIPVHGYFNPDYETPEKLWDRLTGYDVILIPHHPMAASALKWWDFYNPDMECIVEFYSKWGLSLEAGNDRPVKYRRHDNAIFEAFDAGRQYGFIGSTDTHLTRPGSRLKECRPGTLIRPEPGFVAVWATGHTREAIFDALKNRRCYGTTGTRVNLQFSVNGALMGSSIQAYSEPKVAFKATSDETITEVSFIKFFSGSHITLKSYFPNAKECMGSFTESNFLEDASYIMRVDLANTDMALSSPIWVEKVDEVI